MFSRTNTFIQVWNYLRMSNWWHNFHFWVNYPFNVWFHISEGIPALGKKCGVKTCLMWFISVTSGTEAQQVWVWRLVSVQGSVFASSLWLSELRRWWQMSGLIIKHSIERETDTRTEWMRQTLHMRARKKGSLFLLTVYNYYIEKDGFSWALVCCKTDPSF